MKRRELLKGAAVFGFMSALPFSAISCASSNRVESAGGPQPKTPEAKLNPLKPPPDGSIPVAFLLSEGAVLIDFCGPWEVFRHVDVPDRNSDAFQLYTVAETAKPLHAGGMKIIPDYILDTAPAPKVIVIPAQQGHSEKMLNWIRNSTKSADLTMSVCTGAFLLARTGLLSGKAATTHHNAFRELSVQFPDIQVKRGARFVEEGNLATAGGLSSGIDLALRVVERYFGREVANQTAYQMEYQGQGWLNPDSNEIYAKKVISTDEHPRCPVCEMELDPKIAVHADYKGKTYYFCSQDHMEKFKADPEKYLAAAKAKT